MNVSVSSFAGRQRVDLWKQTELLSPRGHRPPFGLRRGVTVSRVPVVVVDVIRVVMGSAGH